MCSIIGKFGRIGILMGGYSSEREISLKSGKAVCDALNSSGCCAVPLDIVDKEEGRILSVLLDSQIDVAFISLHGRLGEDGTIQSILEKAGIPYTGSGVAASRMAINKISSQNLFRQNGINIPEYIALSKNDIIDVDSIFDEINSSIIVVKPACEGSSIGITFVHEKGELQPALGRAFRQGKDVLLERYIKGRELTVGILEHEALPVVEVRPCRDFFDFTAKYQDGKTEYLVPANIHPDVTSQIQDIALKVHRILGCAHFSRVDFILDENVVPYVLEANTIPGFTSTSLLPKAAGQTGIDFKQLCLKLVELAYGKKNGKEEKIKNAVFSY